MAELYPLPLGLHLRRIFHELRRQGQIYDLPASKFWRPKPGRDLSVNFHGRPAATALGPAAGPQDQLVQNIILSWLGGSRIIELKTVQILDELSINRPCIYAGNIGLNVEWSQELRLRQSQVEYVAASMIIDILRHTDLLGFGADLDKASPTIFDLSVGYGLQGISSPAVRSFMEGCMDATATVDQLRQELPDEFAHLRDVPFRTNIAKSVTLSTLQGCPKEEIERICEFLLKDLNLHTVIKLNPTQLERKYLEHLLNEKLGYSHLTVNPKAFATALSLDEAVDIMERLEPLAKSRGLSIGVKFCNTLECLNNDRYFSDEVMHMSGPPLHVIAMTLVEEWRRRVGDRYPVTFAGGIDRDNFPDALALALTPVTTCTDLLKTRGYGRLVSYLNHLEEKMDKVGAADVSEWIMRAYGNADAALLATQTGSDELAPLLQDLQGQKGSLSGTLESFCSAHPHLDQAARNLYEKAVRQAALLNTSDYAAKVRENSRYHHANNNTAPKKVGSALFLWDCLACGQCVPVCPNDANFTYDVEPAEIEGRNFKIVGSQVLPEEPFNLKIRKGEQWAVYADFCNECGNCDVYCPEDGGPFAQKPKYFGDMETFRHHQDRDGFLVERADGKDRVWGRLKGGEYYLEVDTSANTALFTDHVLELSLDRRRPAKPTSSRIVEPGHNGHILDMKYYFWMEKCLEGAMNPSKLNYVNIRHLTQEQLER